MRVESGVNVLVVRSLDPGNKAWEASRPGTWELGVVGKELDGAQRLSIPQHPVADMPQA